LKTFFFTILLVQSISAKELPSKYFDLSVFINKYRQLITDKYIQLSQNFTQREDGQQILFLATKEVKCINGIKLNTNEIIGSLRYSQESIKDISREVISYTGCQNKSNFFEEITTKTQKREDLKWENIKKGNLRIRINNNESERMYRLLDYDNEEILRIDQVRVEKNVILTTFHGLGSKMFVIWDNYSTGHMKTFVSPPFNINYSKDGYRFNMNFSTNNEQMLAHLKTDNNVLLQTSERLISFDEFNSSIEFYRNIINRIPVVFVNRKWLSSYPKTKFVNAGTTNTKLIDELTVNFNRLLTNTQLNLVRIFLEELLKSAKENELVDRRPQDKK